MIDENYSILSVAYATSQVESMNDILLYIPLTPISDGCIQLTFSDGWNACRFIEISTIFCPFETHLNYEKP